MYCMKCGKETKENQVFCDACLVIMDKHPVKPGTHIQIPQRPASHTSKPVSRKRSYTPEEQVLRLRRSVKGLVLALVCTILAFGLTITFLAHSVAEARQNASIGKNYNTIEANIP